LVKKDLRLQIRIRADLKNRVLRKQTVLLAQNSGSKNDTDVIFVAVSMVTWLEGVTEGGAALSLGCEPGAAKSGGQPRGVQEIPALDAAHFGSQRVKRRFALRRGDGGAGGFVLRGDAGGRGQGVRGEVFTLRFPMIQERRFFADYYRVFL
jgi:hypothetical protein